MITAVESSAQVTLYFEKANDAAELLRELKTWTPRHGWSEDAQDLFRALSVAANVRIEDAD